MRILRADMDAVVLAAVGLLIGAGILLHVWGRLKLGDIESSDSTDFASSG